MKYLICHCEKCKVDSNPLYLFDETITLKHKSPFDRGGGRPKKKKPLLR